MTTTKIGQYAPNVAHLFDVSELPVEKAKDLTARRETLLAEAEKYSHDAVEAVYMAKPGECSKAERQARGREKREAINEAVNALHRDETKPFIMPIIRTCAQKVEAAADKLALRDAADCEKYGLPALESELVIALRTKARQLRATADAIEAKDSDQGGPLDILRNEVGLKI